MPFRWIFGQNRVLFESERLISKKFESERVVQQVQIKFNLAIVSQGSYQIFKYEIYLSCFYHRISKQTNFTQLNHIHDTSHTNTCIQQSLRKVLEFRQF